MKHLNTRLNGFATSLGRSRLMSHTHLQYFCAACGPISLTVFFIGILLANMIPPPRPTWHVEHIARFYQNNNDRIKAGAVFIAISGIFYLPFSAAISYQISRIPNASPLAHTLQMAAAAAGTYAFTLPGIILALTAYRPERDPEITQLMHDFFWLCAIMTWPTFLLQDFIYGYAILMDDRENAPLPKWLALINLVLPFGYCFSIGIHCVYDGPAAWNGAIGFWTPAVIGGILFGLDSWSVFIAAREETKEQKQLENVVIPREDQQLKL